MAGMVGQDGVFGASWGSLHLPHRAVLGDVPCASQIRCFLFCVNSVVLQERVLDRGTRNIAFLIPVLTVTLSMSLHLVNSLDSFFQPSSTYTERKKGGVLCICEGTG